jgi:hypothetical protein
VRHRTQRLPATLSSSTHGTSTSGVAHCGYVDAAPLPTRLAALSLVSVGPFIITSESTCASNHHRQPTCSTTPAFLGTVQSEPMDQSPLHRSAQPSPHRWQLAPTRRREAATAVSNRYVGGRRRKSCGTEDGTLQIRWRRTPIGTLIGSAFVACARCIASTIGVASRSMRSTSAAPKRATGS